MKFRPDPRKRDNCLSVYLYKEDIELLKTWANQQDMKIAQLTAQIIEHQLRESKIEILTNENKVRRVR